MMWRDCCDIRISGRNPYPFVNALRRSSAACGEQRCVGEVFYGRIHRRDLPVVERLAAEFGMQLEVQELRSVGGKLRRYRLRFGLVLGLLLGAGLIFYQSNVVETIEIHGANQTDERVILSLLAEEGVSRGTWIADIDMLHCERRLMTSVEEIAWAGLRHTGNRLVVDIAEATTKPEMLRERLPCNIIARYDAQITGVQVHAGQLCHLIGDGVVKGELLVGGVWNDDLGHTRFFHANAKITGIYTREAELTEYFTQTETVPTGRTIVRKRLRIFGLEIPLTPHKKGFVESRITEQEIPLGFLGFTLPCGVIRQTETELAVTEITRTEEETRLALNELIVRYEKNLLTDAAMLDRSLTYETNADGVTCRMRYQLEGEIGESRDIYYDAAK